MSGPTVGEVRIKAAIDGDHLHEDLRSQLTKELQAEVLPQLKALHAEMEGFNEEMGKVTSRSFEEMATHAGIASKEVEEVGKATRTASRAEVTYRNQVRTTGKAIKARSDAARKYREEIRANGVAQTETERDYWLAAEKAYNAIIKRDTAYAEWQAKLENIERRRTKAQEDHARAVLKANDAEAQGYRDLIKNAMGASDAIIKDAVNRSNLQIKEHQRVADSHQASINRQIQNERALGESMIKQIERVRRAQDAELKRRGREDDRKRRMDEQNALFNSLSNYGRKVGNIQQIGGQIGVAGAVTAISDLITVAGTLSGVLGGLPALISAVGIAMGTWELATAGVSDAIGALVSGDMDKFTKAMDALPPSVRSAVSSLSGLVPVFNDLRNEVGADFWQDLGPQITSAINTLLPTIRTAVGGVADVLNDAIKEFMGALESSSGKNSLDTAVANIVEGFKHLLPVVEPVTNAILTLIEAGSTALPGFSDMLVDWANKFNDLIQSAAASGELDKWIKDGFEALKAFAPILADVVDLFIDLAPIGKLVLPEIVAWFDNMKGPLEVIIGSIALISAAFMKLFDTVMGPIKMGFENLKSAVAAIGDAFTGAWNKAVPALNGMLDKIRPIYNALKAVAGIAGWNLPDMPEFKEINGRSVGGGGFGPGANNLDLANRYAAADAAGGFIPTATNPQPGVRVLPRSGITVGVDPGDMADKRGQWDKQHEADKPSDADRKKEIEASINPEDFKVDPWATVGAPRVATNGGLNVNILGAGGPNIPGLTNPGGSLWDKVAQGESSGRWDDNNSGGHTTSSGAPRGGLQITDGTWAAFGGQEFAPTANLATREQQIEVANRIAFSGYQGTAPQGLQAWEAITKGMVPGVTSSTPQSAFMGTPTASAALPGNFAGARNVTGLDPSQVSPGILGLAQLVAQQFPGVNLGGWRPSDGPNTPTGHQRGVALDIGIQDQAMGDQINEWLRANAAQLGIKSTIWRDKWADFQGNTSTVPGHQDHVHVESLGQAIATAMRDPNLDLGQNMYATNGPMMMNPGTGEMGYMQVDQQALQRAAQSVENAGRDLQKAGYELAVATEQHKQNLINDQDLLEKQNAYQEAQQKLQNEQMDYAEAERGKFKKGEEMDYSKLPFGDPRRIAAGAITGAGGTNEDVAAILGPLFGAAAGPLGKAAGDATTNALSALNLPVREAPPADLNALIAERNPLALANMAGYNVPDYTVRGAGANADNLMTNQGPAFDASGRIFSDTSALIDRSFTSLQGALEAKLDQLESVLNQVKDQLGEQLLGPVVENAVKGALQGAGEALGTAIGQTAGPIIAQAVAAAIPSGGGGGGTGNLVTTATNAVIHAGSGFLPGPAGFVEFGGTGGGAFGPLFGTDRTIGGLYDEGGLWPSGTFGTNLSGANERVLSPMDTRLFDAGLLGGWNLQPQQQHFATVEGVDSSATAGADFFGLSQVPIIGAIVSMLINVLLKVIGVTIEERDTLDEMAGDFRKFRGDAFEAFDAQGRLMNDTSALLDRTSTSEQAAADERIRILKLVIEGLIKYIIEELIVPIGKAVAGALVQAGAGAASGAIGASFPGGSIVGGMVGSVITSAGNAAIDIGAQVYTDFATSLTDVITDGVGDAIEGLFPNTSNAIFGGGLLSGLFDPIGGVLSGILGPLLGLFTSIIPFDEGGVAVGTGFMPKATISPERVLPPATTRSFDRLVDLLDKNGASGLAGGGNRTVYVGGITVQGDQRTAERIGAQLTDLLT